MLNKSTSVEKFNAGSRKPTSQEHEQIPGCVRDDSAEVSS